MKENRKRIHPGIVAAISMGIGLCLLFFAFTLAPLPGERVECDACVGAGLLLMILLGCAVGAGGGLLAILLGIMGLFSEDSEKGRYIWGIILGLISIFATPAVWLGGNLAQ